MKKYLLVFCCLIGFTAAKAQYGSFDAAHPVSPFKIFDNLYYVGNDAVSAYLITTEKGIILIDALYAKFTADIPKACRQLGLRAEDIKYIICTHGHFDHCEGAEEIQKISQSRIGMTDADWKMADGSVKADYVSVTTKLKRDWTIKDGDSLQLGNTTLRFYETPGHTPGVLSIAFPVRDGNKIYSAFMFGGVGLNFEGVARTESYLHSLDRIAAMHNIDVNISNHPGPGKIFEYAALLKQRKPGGLHPFVAPAAFQQWLLELRKAAQAKLMEEKKKSTK
jgi:metallo-beta-lactamase class B